MASAPIQTTAEIFEHEQTRALGILGRPTADEIECVGVPISFDGVRPAPLGAAPDVGQFNDEFHALLKSARVS
ncbi:CAIB/BAIF family protein [Bordetella pertussis]|nr:CAIB/BAIF family protein [Bordetella pertussis]